MESVVESTVLLAGAGGSDCRFNLMVATQKTRALVTTFTEH